MAAKDGTNRGGARPGAGAKKKPLEERILEGKADAGTLPFPNSADLESQPMPRPASYLSSLQKDGTKTEAVKIYKKTWKWLKERGVASLVSPQLLEQYAQSAARYIQCEEYVSQTGFLAAHPTTGKAIASPFVTMSQSYLAQTNRLWTEIYDIVRQYAETSSVGNPHDDLMEQLLRKRQT